MKPEKICIQQFAEYQLPPVNNQLHKGLAGAIIGVCQGRIIIAGGSNFDNGYPWQGGIKKYFKDIYWADVKSCIESTTFRLLDNVKLPEAIAYGANVSTQNGLYSIGGENEKGELNEVLCITWEDSTASIQSAVAYPFQLRTRGNQHRYEHLCCRRRFAGDANFEIFPSRLFKLKIELGRTSTNAYPTRKCTGRESMGWGRAVRLCDWRQN
jgi:hypothetical protein